MSRKVALLIGVSEYGEGIPSLSAPPNDVAAMERVLKDSKMGGFDEVKTLINRDQESMRIAIEQIFANRRKEDLVLLFFSGHGITDDSNRLYLTTKGTSKDFFKATSVPASFVQDLSRESYAKRQVIVLDCCYSGAFAEGWQTKSVGLDLQKELGAEGRVVLTSSTATQTSFQQEGEELSLYTKYLVEGIETGAADQDGDGKIYAQELHKYAKVKVKEVKPKMEPGIIIDREGFNILLSQAPVNDPELQYRQWVEKYATHGKITVVGKKILRVKCQELGIIESKSDAIVNEVLAPYRQRLENIESYKQALTEAVEQNYPLTERLQNELQDFQDVLGLEDKDIAAVKQQILAQKEAEHQRQLEAQRQQEREEYENKLQRYKQEFTKAIQAGYPLDESVRDGLKNFQRSLELTNEDVTQIEEPILAQAKTRYQEKLQEEESERRRREAERVKQLELQKQRQQAEQAERQKKQQQSRSKALVKSRDETDDLTSVRGVDYTKLRELLAAGKWKEADEETAKRMLEVANREEEGWLRVEDIDNFPCEDLRTINQLWVKYSNGRFGFSVQKEIYLGIGGTREYNGEIWKKFCEQVGWRKKGFMGFGGKWLSYSELTFELRDTTPKGHLPSVLLWGLWCRGLVVGGGRCILLSRTDL